MLRLTKKTSKYEQKRRHSTFLDLKSLPKDGADDGAHVKNSSADKDNRRLDDSKKINGMKRMSTVLDENMVRDYDLVLQHFENEKTGADINHDKKSRMSMVSNGSNVSSLFSSSSALSIRDFLYEEFESKDLTKEKKALQRKSGQFFNTRKALFVVPDKSETHSWMSVTDGLEFLNDDHKHNVDFSRTALDFY